MPRARNIKPAFFTNEELGELSPCARLAFIGLWSEADFNGNLLYRPKKLKIQILPYDDVDFRALMTELESAGCIRVYRVDQQDYLHVVNFTKHQRPHRNEVLRGTDIPQPGGEPDPDPDQTERPNYEPERERDHASNKTQQRRDENGSNPPDTGYLIPDTGYRIADTGHPDADAPEPAKPKPKTKATNDPRHDDAFATFWSAYPKRPAGDDKRRAREAFAKRLKDGVDPQTIMDGLTRYSAYLKATGGLGTNYTMQAATFVGPSEKYLQPWQTGPQRLSREEQQAVQTQQAIEEFVRGGRHDG